MRLVVVQLVVRETKMINTIQINRLQASRWIYFPNGLYLDQKYTESWVTGSAQLDSWRFAILALVITTTYVYIKDFIPKPHSY